MPPRSRSASGRRSPPSDERRRPRPAASAAVLVALPVVVGGWSAGTDRRVSGFLLTTPVGLACTGAGSALILLGALWMGRLVRGEA